jgi:ABC-type Fe3+/spermidine/putrescine transport system ATPase subunit
MAAGPLIELDKVTKSFDGGNSFALRDVSLAVAAGAFIALVGASGSGRGTARRRI